MQKVLKVSLILVVAIALGVYALNSVVNGADEPTPAERMEKIQKSWDEAYLKGNLDALEESMVPDYVRHVINEPDVIGLDAVKETIKQHRLIFSECRVIIDELFVSGDYLIAQWTFKGTYAGDTNSNWVFQNKESGGSETMDISVSGGTKYTAKGCSVTKEVNGKSVESWMYTSSIIPILTAAGMELKIEPVEE
jgi:hypothetical protein